jgi:hypothetical protein
MKPRGLAKLEVPDWEIGTAIIPNPAIDTEFQRNKVEKTSLIR